MKTPSTTAGKSHVPWESTVPGGGGAPPLLTPLTDEQKKSIRILVVEDEESLCESCSNVLEQEGYEVRACTRGSDAEPLLRQGTSDIVLLDLYMSGVPGAKLLKVALEARADTLVIVMTGRPSVESSIEALREGAWDYIPKPFGATHLQVLVGRAAHTVIVGRETVQLNEESRGRGKGAGVALLGQSPGLRAIVDLAERVAATDASVFITGESGSGKEMVAQYIHQSSRRSSRQLVAVNCAAIPEALLESEMFGHVKGAFTGAVRDKQGLMEAANGGTLFLDELTEMSLPTQAKLLRVVQDGVVRRVGSSGTDAVVNVRFIASTNRDPGTAVREGHLREDLYYRLRVVPIHIPPLRERPEDIPVLASHFLDRYWNRHRDGPPPTFTDDAIRVLEERAWPGNVRELQNVIEHAVVLATPGGTIGGDDVPSFEHGARISPTLGYTMPSATLFASGGYHAARDRVLARFEKDYLTWVLRQAEGNMSEAARVAGVDRTTLYRLLDKHGLAKSELMEE